MLPKSHLSPLSMGALDRDQVRLLPAVSQLREGKVDFEHLVNWVPSVPILSHTPACSCEGMDSVWKLAWLSEVPETTAVNLCSKRALSQAS